MEDGFQRVCEYNCKEVYCIAGANHELYLGQLNLLGIVLHYTLETPLGLLFLTQYANNRKKYDSSIINIRPTPLILKRCSKNYLSRLMVCK